MSATDLTANPDFRTPIDSGNVTKRVCNVQLACNLLAVTGVGAAAYQDNSGVINNPEDDITNYTYRITNVAGLGTSIGFSLRYDDATVAVAQECVIEVFGRGDSSDVWKRLFSKSTAPAITSELTAAPLTSSVGQDAQDGTYKYTSIDPCDNVFDLMSSDEIVVAIRDEFQGDAEGDDDLCTVMAVLISS